MRRRCGDAGFALGPPQPRGCMSVGRVGQGPAGVRARERRGRRLADWDGAILAFHFSPLGAALLGDLGALCSAPLAEAPPQSLGAPPLPPGPAPYPAPPARAPASPAFRRHPPWSSDTRAWELRAPRGARAVPGVTFQLKFPYNHHQPFLSQPS